MQATKQQNFLAQFRDTQTKKLKRFTATQFADVWSHYDTDGNGFIEGKELEHFLREFLISEAAEKLPENELEKLKKGFMEAFDTNKDNKIDIQELAQILPMDENFLLIFRQNNPLESSIEFMKVWKKFDKDKSGYIESGELKDFLTQFLAEAKPKHAVTPEKLEEYTKIILQLFDSNKDGKLQLSEMSRLLPVRENYLCKPVFKNAGKLTPEDIDKIFKVYDKDGNGTIENEELQGFLKDLLECVHEQYTSKELEFFKDVVLSQWDVNHDGKISADELKMILNQQHKAALSGRDEWALQRIAKQSCVLVMTVYVVSCDAFYWFSCEWRESNFYLASHSFF